MVTYSIRNLAKHGVTFKEIDEVLTDSRTIWLDLGVNRHGSDRLMFVGVTLTGRLLEVGVELMGEDEHVFHAQNAGKLYLKEFADAQKRNS